MRGAYKLKKDRLVAGGLAGAIGALVQNAYGQSAKALKLTDRAFIDYAEVLLAHKVFGGVLGFIVGTLAHLAVGVIMGVIFAYIIMLTSSRYLYIKGLGYGFVLWLLLSGFGSIFNLPQFTLIPPNVALATLVGALIYGIVNAFTLGYLEKRIGLV